MNRASLEDQRLELGDKLSIEALIFVLQNFDCVNCVFEHEVVGFGLQMDRQDAQQLTNVIVIEHSNDLVLGLNLVKVPGDVLEFVCVNLLIDEVFNLFLPFDFGVDLLTCVEDSRYSGDDVGVESHSDQDNQYVGCCF